MDEHINTIKALHIQIEALLDLMQCAGDITDIHSINVASEMCQTMLDDLMSEVYEIKKSGENNELLG